MRSGCRQGARTQVRSYLRRIRTWTWTCESRTKLVLSTLPWAVALCRRHLTALPRRRRTGPCSLLAAVCMYVASRPGKLLAPMHVRQADGIRRRAVPCSTNKLKLWLGCCVCCLCYVAVRRQVRDGIWTKKEIAHKLGSLLPRPGNGVAVGWAFASSTGGDQGQVTASARHASAFIWRSASAPVMSANSLLIHMNFLLPLSHTRRSESDTTPA